MSRGAVTHTLLHKYEKPRGQCLPGFLICIKIRLIRDDIHQFVRNDDGLANCLSINECRHILQPKGDLFDLVL